MSTNAPSNNEKLMNVNDLVAAGTEAKQHDLGNADRALGAEIEDLQKQVANLDEQAERAALNSDETANVRDFVVERETVKTILEAKQKQRNQISELINKKRKLIEQRAYDFKWEHDSIGAAQKALEAAPKFVEQINKAMDTFHFIKDNLTRAVNNMPVSPAVKREFKQSIAHIERGDNLTVIVAQQICHAIGASHYSNEARFICPGLAGKRTVEQLVSNDLSVFKMIRSLHPYDPEYDGISLVDAPEMSDE